VVLFSSGSRSAWLGAFALGALVPLAAFSCSPDERVNPVPIDAGTDAGATSSSSTTGSGGAGGAGGAGFGGFGGTGGAGADRFVEGTAANGSDKVSGQGGLDTVDYSGRTNGITATLAGVADDGEAGEAEEQCAEMEPH